VEEAVGVDAANRGAFTVMARAAIPGKSPVQSGMNTLPRVKSGFRPAWRRPV
jgi:hypothetical protein